MRHSVFPFLFLPAFLPFLTATAQTTSLPEVEVTSSRIPTPFSASTRTVDIIDSSYISSAPVTTIQQLLEYHAGVDVRTRGPLGVQSDISIRGSNFEQALILVNGIKISDPQTGHHVFNLPVSLDDVERIEILKGSGARAFGQNAFSGAINIITKNPEQTQLRLRALYGQHNLHEVGLAFTHVQEGITQTISGTYAASDGYRENTDFSNKNLYYSSQIKAGQSRVLLNAGVNDKAFGANGFYSDRFPGQWEATRTLFFSTGLQTGSKNTFTPRLYFRQHNDEFLLKRNEPAFYRNQHTTNVSGAEFNYTIPWRAGSTALGGEIRNEALTSSSLGNRERQNAGFTAEHRVVFWDRLTLTPGFYLNWTNSAKWQLYPGMDVGLALTEGLGTYASVNRSFRIPSFTELYYRDPANQGNAALKPEQAWTYEAGMRYSKSSFRARVAAFSREGENLIDWIKTGNVWMAGNIGQVQTTGGEAQIGYVPGAANRAQFLQRIDLQYAYLHSSSELNAEQSKYVLDHLRHQVIAGLEHRLFGPLLHSVKVRYEDRRIYKPYLLVDSRLAWRGNRYMAFIQAQNLTGTTYYEVGRIPMPGRWVSAGFEYTLPIRKRPQEVQ